MKIANTIISSLFIMAVVIVIGAVVCFTYGVISEGFFAMMDWIKNGTISGIEEVVEETATAAVQVWVAPTKI